MSGNIFLEKKKKQMQVSRGALRKRCSENKQQIYRTAPMLKCDFTLDCCFLKKKKKKHTSDMNSQSDETSEIEIFVNFCS